MEKIKIDANITNSDENEYSYAEGDTEKIVKKEYPIKVDLEMSDKTIIDIKQMMERDEIILSPDFQRKFVWNKKNISKLIESLIIGIPVPPIYLYEDKNMKWEVVDGQQRLRSINEFLGNKHKLNGLELLPELNGFTYKKIGTSPEFFKYAKLLERAVIRFVIIDNRTREEIKFNLFERINTGANKLNPQEVRNAIYHGPFNDFLIALANSDEFKKFISTQKNLKKRMGNVELVARFFAIYEELENNFEKYGGSTKDSIIRVYELNKSSFKKFKSNSNNISKYESLFLTALKRIHEILGYDAFISGENNRINRVLFEMFMVGFATISEEYFVNIDKKYFKQKLLEEYSSPSNIDVFKIGTNNSVAIKRRFKIFNEIIRGK